MTFYLKQVASHTLSYNESACVGPEAESSCKQGNTISKLMDQASFSSCIHWGTAPTYVVTTKRFQEKVGFFSIVKGIDSMPQPL